MNEGWVPELIPVRGHQLRVGKTDYWVASPKVSTLVYLRNPFTDCYSFTAWSTDALELSEAPVSRILQSAIRHVSLTVIAPARAAI